MLSSLIEHSARRSWIIWNVVSRQDGVFSQPAYNQLLDALNASPDKRLASVKSFRPAQLTDQHASASVSTPTKPTG
jgi:hypothetical protein